MPPSEEFKPAMLKEHEYGTLGWRLDRHVFSVLSLLLSSFYRLYDVLI